jgi:hypothetical protein
LALQRIQAELNLSVTPFEVLEDAHAEDSHPDDGFEETRVRSIASVDPDQTGHAPTFPARVRPAAPSAFTPVVPAAPVAGPARGPAPGPVPGPVPGQGARPEQHDDWSQGTMLRGSVAAESRPGGPGDADIAATVNRPQAVQEASAEAPVDHSKRNLWLAVAGGAVLVVAVILGLVLGASRPEPVVKPTEKVSAPPPDALGDGSVPNVTNLVGKFTESGKARFTWTNPDPRPGDSYKWRIKTVKGGGSYLSTSATRVDVTANPAEPTCVQVIIVRRDGSASPAGEDSIACL